MDQHPLTITLKNYRCFVDQHPARFTIGPGVTAFLGTNNAGKTAVLRFLAEFSPAFSLMSERKGMADLLNRKPDGLKLNFRLPEDTFTHFNDRSLQVGLGFADADYTIDLEITVDRSAPDTLRLTRLVLNGTTLERWNHDSTEAEGIVLKSPHPTHLATFMATIQDLASTTLIGANRPTLALIPNLSAITKNSERSRRDSAENFVQVWARIKNSESFSDRQIARVLSETVAEVLGFDQFDLDQSASGSNLIVRINGDSLTIDDVGAGVWQVAFLILTVLAGKTSYLLLDEPELSLHPRLQIQLLDALSKRVPVGIVMATHSPGLVRYVADQAFIVRQNSDGHSTITGSDMLPSVAAALGEIGFASSFEFGVARVLLVEGKHDVKVFRAILSTLGVGRDVLVLALGGAEFISSEFHHFLPEFLRLSESVLTIVDSERSSMKAPALPRVVDYQLVWQEAGLQNRCHVLERRAIENYFTQDALDRTFGPGRYQVLSPVERLQGQWGKNDNWRIAKNLSREDLLATDLGQFIQRAFATRPAPNLSRRQVRARRSPREPRLDRVAPDVLPARVNSPQTSIGKAARTFAEDLINQNIAGLMMAFTPNGMGEAMALQGQLEGQSPVSGGAPTVSVLVLSQQADDAIVHLVMDVEGSDAPPRTIVTRWKDVGGSWKVDGIALGT